jgi:uncharacterized protein involved in response to NO
MSPNPDHPDRFNLPLLALGFRPFFLVAGIWAVLAIGLWLAMLRGWIPMDRYYAGTTWHAHEMLFGYGLAVIAGFLLTAARNWTDLPTATGAALGGLVLLWASGRIAPLLPIPVGVTAALDLSFPAILALSLYRPLWRGPNPVNRVFIALMAGMSAAAALVHLQALGVTGGTALIGDRLMLGLILLTLLIVAGRVMPFFTRVALPGVLPKTRPWVERLTFALAPLWVAGDALAQGGWPTGAVTATLALALALVQGLRLAGWYERRVRGIPILAVLYAGYLWLIVGLLLNVLAHLGLSAPWPSLHALTVGAIGVFTLGMMARVTLGHTGRAMRASVPTVVAFVLLNLSALLRVFPPFVWPSEYSLWLMLSGTLWILAFLLFLWVHLPMLVRRRVDGQPG